MATKKAGKAGGGPGGKKISRGAAGELLRKAGRRTPDRAAHASSPKPKKSK